MRSKDSCRDSLWGSERGAPKEAGFVFMQNKMKLALLGTNQCKKIKINVRTYK